MLVRVMLKQAGASFLKSRILLRNIWWQMNLVIEKSCLMTSLFTWSYTYGNL